MTPSYSAYSNAAGTVITRPDGYVHIRWHAGERRPADFQAALEHALRALLQQRTGKMLIDQRLMAAMSEEEQAWVSTNWLPRATEAGYRYAAWLPSYNVMARLGAQQVVARVGNGRPTYQLCETEEEAAAWLLRQV